MVDLLAYIDSKYGGVSQYMEKIGFTAKWQDLLYHTLTGQQRGVLHHRAAPSETVQPER